MHHPDGADAVAASAMQQQWLAAGFFGRLPKESPGTVEDQPVLLEFPGLAGVLPIVSGNSVGVGAEVGITGVRLTLPADDRLWVHMITIPHLSYGVRGTNAMMDIPGDQNSVIAGFVSARSMRVNRSTVTLC